MYINLETIEQRKSCKKFRLICYGFDDNKFDKITGLIFGRYNNINHYSYMNDEGETIHFACHDTDYLINFISIDYNSNSQDKLIKELIAVCKH